MTFFARPDLSDVQFRQCIGSQLTLSGETRIATTSGLTLVGDSGYIPLHATGASVNYVMTYDADGVIRLKESTISGTTLPFSAGTNTITRFCNNTEYNVNVGASTVTTFLEEFFFPSVPPASSLSVATSFSGGSTSASVREFGDASFGNLCWSVTCCTYPLTCIALDTSGDGTYNCSVYSGVGTGTTNGTVPYTYIPGNLACPTGTGNTCCAVTYRLSACTCTGEVPATNPATAAISWRNKRYDYLSSTAYDSANTSGLDTSLVSSPRCAVLTTSKAMCCTITFNNQFFYYAYPKVFGTPTFVINGLPNNAWGNLTTGTLFELPSFTNCSGYSGTTYYVARSDSRITGDYTISIT